MGNAQKDMQADDADRHGYAELVKNIRVDSCFKRFVLLSHCCTWPDCKYICSMTPGLVLSPLRDVDQQSNFNQDEKATCSEAYRDQDVH